ncbi:guanitoxin biosynthesis L-enduracididine beta-hydroxylase GntD [Dactylosporangium darangshiense]|uniref:Clavaminate synthase family protein n=1 Tax=Dactylosporangium darangshiense TaxID=579108 RepID=A0ABP8DSJ2_9ACTN
MDILSIDAAELRVIEKLLDECVDELEDVESDSALRRITVLAHELPTRIRAALNDYRLERTAALFVISGYIVDQDRVGPTPKHWRHRAEADTRREEVLLAMVSSLVGDPFGWSTQQDGRLIHDVIPIQGHEHEQLGSSSETLLTWHTEDAFHPLRGDFLSFLCLRNPYAAATTIGYVDALRLPDATRAVLFEDRFHILPDNSHLPKHNSTDGAEVFSTVEEMHRSPDRVAVLFGDPDQPYMRADPYFMSVDEGDAEARDALGEFTEQIDKAMFDLCLADGDIAFLDNFRLVHGRKPFQARYDGTDRWIKRINITHDLRKSRASRPGLANRLIR